MILKKAVWKDVVPPVRIDALQCSSGKLKACVRDHPGVFPVCAITRSFTKANFDQLKSDPDVSTESKCTLPELWSPSSEPPPKVQSDDDVDCILQSVSRAELIAEQK